MAGPANRPPTSQRAAPPPTAGEHPSFREDQTVYRFLFSSSPSKPEATDLVIIDELNSALLERCLNLEQS